MRNKNFTIMVIGQIISLFGNAIQRFSMSLYILDLTGNAAVFSTILAISTIPYILFAPIAGMLADTVNRKKIMVYLDLFCSLLIGAYSVILLSGRDNQIIITAVMFILSICYTLYGPAVTASIPQIVEKEKLTSANGVIQQVGSIVNFAGPIIAGILYSIVGIKVIVIVNAVSFFFSAILELFLEIPDVEKKAAIKNPLINSGVEMKNSFLYLKREKKIILGIIASYGLSNIFVVPILSIVAPYFVKIFLKMSASVYGLVEGISILGMILSGLLITMYPKKFSMKKIHHTLYPMVFCVILMAIAGAGYGNKWALVALFSIGGLGIMMSIGLSNVISLTFIQKEIPQEMLGRVSAFSVAVATASVAPGQLIFGHLIDSNISLSVILFGTAIATYLVTRFVKWNVRQLD
jgi:MFS family permease